MRNEVAEILDKYMMKTRIERARFYNARDKILIKCDRKAYKRYLRVMTIGVLQGDISLHCNVKRV